MEPVKEIVRVFGNEELVSGHQSSNVIVASELLRREVCQVAPEVHVTKDELVILLTAFEARMKTRDNRLIF